MALDTDALCRARSALRAGDVGVGCALQKSRHFKRGHHVLDELARIAVGHQAAVESGRGHLENTPPVDLGHAIFSWRVARGGRAGHSGAAFFSTDARLFLAGGVQLGDTRHRRGRFLHDGDDGARAVALHRHPHRLLSRRVHLRAGRPGHSRGKDLQADRRLCCRMVAAVRAGCGNPFVAGRLSLFCPAETGVRPIRRHRQGEKSFGRIFEDLRNIFSKTENCRDVVISAALPARRGATFENGAIIHARPARGWRAGAGDGSGGADLWHGRRDSFHARRAARRIFCGAQRIEILALADVAGDSPAGRGVHLVRLRAA